MTGLTISEAAVAWNVHRASVKRWIRRGTVEATKDNHGVWRIAEGQQPPPTVYAPVSPRAVQELHLDSTRAAPPEAVQELRQGRPGADLGAELAASRREVELLREALANEREQHRERLAELASDRDHLRELLHKALDRPSLLERLLRALRGSLGTDNKSAGIQTAERAERRS
jgi:hypothetical protein